MSSYVEKLKLVLHSSKLVKFEPVGSLYTAICVCIFNSFDVYVWGAGKDVDVFVQYLASEGVLCKGIIDRNKDLWDKSIGNMRIVSPRKYVDDPSEKKYVFLYSMMGRSDGGEEWNTLRTIYEGMASGYHIVSDERYYVCNFTPTEAWLEEGRRLYYREHEKDLILFLKRLDDDLSRETWIEYVRCFIECDKYRGFQIPSCWKYFFDADGTEIYNHKVDEVWLDCGANHGDTISCYFRNGLNCRKVYAVEGDRGLIKRLEQNVQVFPKEYRDVVEVVPCFVNGSGEVAKRLREDDANVSLIKADIEGFELSLLVELMDIIKSCRPVLALCFYHRKEDFIDIPKIIDENLDDYVLLLRKYVSWCAVGRETTELVFYAIPKERYVGTPRVRVFL